MRIDLNPTRAEAPDPRRAAEPGSAATAGQAANGILSQDTAALSLNQGKIQALVAQVNAQPEIRQEKVAALAKSLASGHYQVTAEQTADALMRQLGARPAS